MITTIALVILGVASGILGFGMLMYRRRASHSSAALAAECDKTAALTEQLAQRDVALSQRNTELAQRDTELALLRREAEETAQRQAEEFAKRQAEDEVRQRERNEMLMLQFERKANEIFETKSRQMKEQNRESLDIVLRPFKDNIADFKRRVEEIYSAENENRGALKTELKNLLELNRRITEETTNLTAALKGNSKVQGDWGETILDTILENSNLRKGIHYTTQTNIKDAEGNNLRPDVILSLPDNKRVVIDSKVSLTGYVNYCSAADDEERRRALSEHLRSVRAHVNELGRKAYQDNVLGSPDFVIMFVPSEPAFLAAVQNDSEIWNDAYARKVIICSPTNLFGMLKIVDDLWKRDDLGRNASRIAKEGAMMYEKFVTFVTTLEGIGKNINSMQANYEKAMKQLSTGTGNLVNRAQKLSALNIKISKSLPESVTGESDTDDDAAE